MDSIDLLPFEFVLFHPFVQVIAKPGTVKTSKRFEAEIYVLTKDEGGRHTAFFSNYRPQFYMRTADITGKVELPEDIKMVMPGDNVTAVFELIQPVPLEPGFWNPLSLICKNQIHYFYNLNCGCCRSEICFARGRSNGRCRGRFEGNGLMRCSSSYRSGMWCSYIY